MSPGLSALAFLARVFDVAVQLKRKSDEQELQEIRKSANADPVGYFNQFVRVSKRSGKPKD